MFDGLISRDEESGPVDALLELIKTGRKTDLINIKTDVEMPHMKFIIKNYRLFLRRKFPEKHPLEIDIEVIQIYKEIRPSYKGHSREHIVKGVTEMKPALLDADLQRRVLPK